jgi:hypothetical protein
LQPVSSKGLTGCVVPVAAHWQRPPAPNCPSLAASDTELSPSVSYIAARWALLPPHLREAILTLVDSGVATRAEEGGAP